MDEVKGLIMWFTDLKVLALIPAIFVAEMNLVSPACVVQSYKR